MSAPTPTPAAVPVVELSAAVAGGVRRDATAWGADFGRRVVVVHARALDEHAARGDMVRAGIALALLRAAVRALDEVTAS